MDRTHKRKLTKEERAEQNTFALACFRRIVSGFEGEGPWDSVKNWDRAVQTLEIHGILPILDRARELPAEVRQAVLEAKLRTATYQTNSLEALNDIAREMKAAGIPFALLKGTYLYELLYRDLFPRAYGDIDLLVPAESVAEAIDALERAEYDRDQKLKPHGTMPRWHFHATLTSKKPGGLPVELHRSMVDRANLYRLPEEELFGRLVEFRVREGGFTVLCAEDELIYLCLHAAKHGILNAVGLRNGFPPEWFCDPAAGNRLLWFLDIELFLRKHQNILDWPAVSERMLRWNVFEDVIDCLGVIKVLQPGSQAEYAMKRLVRISSREHPQATASAGSRMTRRSGVLDRILRSGLGQVLLARSMLANPLLLIRPIRLFVIWRLLAPSPTRLLTYHGRRKRRWLPWLYIMHPFHMLRKMLAP